MFKLQALNLVSEEISKPGGSAVFLKTDPMNHQLAQCYENTASFRALPTWLEICFHFDVNCLDWKLKGVKEQPASQ